MEDIIGRKDELTLLKKVLASSDPELVALYGRRRVGKTYLIRNVFEEELVFELSGLHHATLEQQIENFTKALSKAAGFKLANPSTWLEAFDMLVSYLTPVIKTNRKVIFLDEFPWIHTPKSGFMPAFENFWNTWASRQKNLVVVICGSAASWMIQKVINNRGGLHGRVTRKIRLLPFTVVETAQFLQARKIDIDKLQVLQLYMVMGGIPQYLKAAEKGESAMQVIDKVCFAKNGLLENEFKNLYQSLFDDSSKHINVVRALAKKGDGLNRTEIIAAIGTHSGGGLTQVLTELTESGFIEQHIPFGRTMRNVIYRLTDEYSRFYLKFMEGHKPHGAGSWLKLSSGPSWKSWIGVAFEGICLKHEDALKRELGIRDVQTESSTWRYYPKAKESGAQIDLLIDRRDGCINICEVKFSIDKFTIDKDYAEDLKRKLAVFRENTKTNKTLFLTMITTYGLIPNEYENNLVQRQLTMDFLFRN